MEKSSKKSGLLYGILVVLAFLALYLLILSKIGLAQAPLQVNSFPTVHGPCGATITTIPYTACTGSNVTTGGQVNPDLTGATGPVLTSGTWAGKFQIAVHGSYGFMAFAIDPITGAQTRIP